MRLRLIPSDNKGFKTVKLKKGDNLLERLLLNKIEIEHSCEGSGTCTTCCVLIHGSLPLGSRTEIEEERATERDFQPNERLACQCEVLEDFEISIEVK